MADSALVKRIANVLEWGYTTGPSHPDATFEKLAEQILKVIRDEGYRLLTAAEAEQVRDVCLRAILHTGPRARKREGSSIQPLRDDLRAMVALLSAGQPEAAA